MLHRVLDASPRAKSQALGKEIFAKTSSPSVALGEGFVECKTFFAECIRHLANRPSAVVLGHFTQRARFTVFVEICHDKHLPAKLTTQTTLLAQTSQLPMRYIHISQFH
jgi:hypothetical protein